MSPVALTFDDGPDAAWTPPVLGELARAGVKATFFVVGEQIASPSGPELLSRIVEAGHSVQPHCTVHVRHTELSADALRHDIAAVLDALADHGVPSPSLWRPPYGVLHPQNTERVASEFGLRLALWTDDPGDYAGTAWEDMLTTLGSLREDAVILLHDSRRYAHATDSAANTVALLGSLVSQVHDRGYEIAPIA